MMFTEQDRMGSIWTDPAAGSILEKHFSFLAEERHLAFSYKIMTLREFLDARQELGFTDQERAAFLQELAQLPSSKPLERRAEMVDKPQEASQGAAEIGRHSEGTGLISSRNLLPNGMSMSWS